MADSGSTISAGLLIHTLFYALLNSFDLPHHRSVSRIFDGAQFIGEAQDLQGDENLAVDLKLVPMKESHAGSSRPSAPSQPRLVLPSSATLKSVSAGRNERSVSGEALR